MSPETARKDCADEPEAETSGAEWEAFHVDLRVRRPVSEQRLPMADHE